MEKEVKINNSKIRNIEFLRFFLSCIIFLFHTNNLYRNISFPGSGQLAVDFFFIISGFFLIFEFNEDLSVKDFIKKKIIRLWPLMLFVNIIYLITHIFIKSLIYHTYDNIMELFFLGNVGLNITRGNLGIFWYVSVLFWCSLLYFYLLKYYKRKNVNLFVAISTWFSYVYLIHAGNGVIDGHIWAFNNVFTVGLLRGLGGMGVGYFIGLWYKEYKDRIDNLKLNKITTLIITALEIYLFCWCLYYMIVHKMSYNNNIIFILYFTIFFSLFLSKKGYFTKLLDNDFSVILGRYSYSIYAIHIFIIDLLINTFWKAQRNSTLLYTAGTLLFIFAFLTYHFVEKPSAKYLKRKFFGENSDIA